MAKRKKTKICVLFISNAWGVVRPNLSLCLKEGELRSRLKNESGIKMKWNRSEN